MVAEQGQRRKLAAIMSADVVGYSRLMADDESATVTTLKDYRAAVARIIEQHEGRVVNAPGDNILVEFPSAVEAVQAAVEIQGNIEGRNAELPEDRRMQFRIGINLGDVIEEADGTIYGDGVNIAARMEALADTGGICISSTIHDAVDGKLEFGFDFVGARQVKNIKKPVNVYRVRAEPHDEDASAKGARQGWRPFAMATAVLATLAAVALWLIFDPSTGDQAIDAPDTAQRALPPTDKPSIAVLPFKNLSSEDGQNYFAEGMAEDIITDLSKISGLFVIAHNSSIGAAENVGTTIEGMRGVIGATAAAAELNVRYILQGSVRRSADQVRITVQMLDAKTGDHLWAERYDRALTDIFAVQDEIAENVVAALEVRLAEGERQRLASSYTDNMEAYDLFLRGRRLRGGINQATNAEARALIEQAVAIDPQFAAAHSELSWILSQAAFYQWTDDNDTTQGAAVTTAEKAVALDKSLASGHARLGWAYLFSRRFDDAIISARQALALDPNYADGYLILSEILIYAGRAEEGIATARQGIPMDPYLTYHHELHIANGHVVLGEYDLAIAAANRSIAHNADWPGGYIWLAALHGQRGPREEARAMFAEMLRQTPDFSIEERRKFFSYRDTTITDWMIEGLYKAAGAGGDA